MMPPVKRLIVLFLSVWFVYYANAQSVDNAVTGSTITTDTIIPVPKRPWLGAGIIVGVNLGVWTFDRYALKGDFAYISPKTMKHNLQKGFYWDNDNFMTNLFSHPYHGSIYFNAGRANGMDFWQSGLYSLGGSLMWELFMECELPSTNDLFATSIGGMALGEILYRTSDLVLDNRATGWNRFGRETVGFILSPGRGLTRVLTGDAWKRSRYSGKQFARTDIDVRLMAGIRTMELFSLDSELLDEGIGAVVDVKLNYGDPDDNEETTPYDYFTVHGSFNMQKGQPLIGQLNLMGRLWGKPLRKGPKHRWDMGIYQHFDYYDSDTLKNRSFDIDKTRTPFEIGTPASVGVGFTYKGHSKTQTWKYFATLHINGIILGSSLSDYYRGNERKYNWGSGYATKFITGFTFKDKFEFEIGVDNYHIFTWRGYHPDTDMQHVDYSTLNVQGDRSNALYDILYTSMAYHINKKWSIYYQRYDFFRTTNYYYLPDVYSTTSDMRVACCYRF